MRNKKLDSAEKKSVVKWEEWTRMNERWEKRDSEWTRWRTQVAMRKEEWGSASAPFLSSHPPFFISSSLLLSFLVALRQLHNIAFFFFWNRWVVEVTNAALCPQRAMGGEPILCGVYFFWGNEGKRLCRCSPRKCFYCSFETCPR